MTTATWSSAITHATDADFRTWGSELSAKLAAIGLVQTADTGQINWSTVLRPAINTDAGYEIWRWNDTMQASAPIFMKVYFGTGTAATYPRWRVEFATATNGAGTLSGIGSTIIQPGNYANAGGTASPVPSYFCHTEGYLGWLWKNGASCLGCIMVSRTVTAAGVPDGDGLHIWGYATTTSATSAHSNLRFYRYVSPASVIYSGGPANFANEVAIAPGWLASTLLPSGDKQVYLCWGTFPDVRPVIGMVAYQLAEFATGTTFSVAMVGTTAHTYLATGHASGGILAGGTTYRCGMLWE